MEQSNPHFFGHIIALIKEKRFEIALKLLTERQKTHLNSQRLYSFFGMVHAGLGHFKKAEQNFLNAYANSRNPFYLRQLEEILPKLYDEPLPEILNSVDFVSFFKEREAKLEPVQLSNIPRIIPRIAGQPPEVLPSTMFEEMMLDRGLWVAEDKDVEVIYTQKHHSPLVSDMNVLIEKGNEFPSTINIQDPIFPAFSAALGSTGIISLHSSACSILCRKDLLPKRTFEEEGVFIGGLPNTGHHLLDYLPKLEIWAQTKGTKDIPVYICNASPFYKEMAATLFPQFRYINITEECAGPTLLLFKHLHVPSYLPAGLGFSALRERAKRAGLFGHDTGHKMVYLARGKEHRRLQNEDELVEWLRKLGFAIIDTMKTSFKEMISHISSADILMGGIGAQNSYMVFCKPGTEFIDIMPDIYLDDEGWQFNERLYSYSQVILQKVRGVTDNSDPVASKYNWLYTCNIQDVENAVSESAARKNAKVC